MSTATAKAVAVFCDPNGIFFVYMGERRKHMEDKQIIELYFTRSEEAIGESAKKYGGYCRTIAGHILPNAADAEECVSDAYLAVWNTIPPARPDPLSAYICRLGRNCALKKLRSRTALKRSGYEVSLEELSECIPGSDTETAWQAQALGEAIDRYLATLTKENRVIFLRRYWFGDSLKDISRRMGIRENTLAVRLSRIRDDLKDYLIKEGFL